MKDPLNLSKMAEFLTKTFDKIATPLKNFEKLPEEFFEIHDIINEKLPESSLLRNYVLKYCKDLKNSNKYNISTGLFYNHFLELLIIYSLCNENHSYIVAA